MEARPRIFSRQRSIGGLFPGTVLPAMGRERILIEQVFNAAFSIGAAAVIPNKLNMNSLTLNEKRM